MYIALFLIMLIIAIAISIPNPNDVKNLKHVEIINYTKLYEYRYENSGFSIGKGGFRAHYGKRKHYIGTEVKFQITYTSGKTATVTAQLGTKRCQTLLDFIENGNKSNEAHENICTTDKKHKNQGIAPSKTKTRPSKMQKPEFHEIYTAGMYKVGVTIPAGEYAIYTTEEDGSYYRVKNNDQELFSGYAKCVQLIELQNGDYIEFSDATLQSMDNLDLVGMNLPSCSLKAGLHIPIGEYLLTSLNGEENYVSVYSSCRLIPENLILSDYVTSSKFITLKENNVISYENCKIELVEEFQHHPSIQQKNHLHSTICKECDIYRNGHYSVGDSIPQGEYAIFSIESKETTIQITSKKDKKLIHTLSFSGCYLLTLQQGDLFEISNGYAIPLSKVDKIPTDTQSYMLKVGLHITAGAYRINQIDNKHFAIYYILTNSTINLEKAIDSDAIWGTANLHLKNGNYIFLENAVLVPI